MKVECFFCHEEYKPHITNMRMIGPNLIYTCPFCNRTAERKLNKFVELQIDPDLEMPRFDRARALIVLAKEIEKATDDENKRNKKEKNSNV